MTVRPQQEKRGWAFGGGVILLKPILLATTTQRWEEAHHFPESGGFVVVMNHISHIDPITACHFFEDHGRVPRFLTKANLFDVRGLGAVLRNSGQIPVQRQSADAATAFSAAVDAVRGGKCLVIYPEGTLTRDPALWPMTGKTGAARISFETGCPVIPIGQWGAHRWLAPYGKVPKPFPRKEIAMRVGPPVDLDDLRDQPDTAKRVQVATDRIMDDLTALVEHVRGETAPAERFDMKKHNVRRTGNPNRKEGS